jgi:hypothetical protein
MDIISGQVYKTYDGRSLRLIKAKWDSHFKAYDMADQPMGTYDAGGNKFDGDRERDTLLPLESREAN